MHKARQHDFFNRVSPLHALGLPTVVYFGFIGEDVVEVDEENLSIELEFKMSMRWADPRVMLTAFVSEVNPYRSSLWANISAMTREQRAIDIDTRHVSIVKIWGS